MHNKSHRLINVLRSWVCYIPTFLCWDRRALYCSINSSKNSLEIRYFMPWASRYLWHASVRLTLLHHGYQVSSPLLYLVRNVIWALLFGLPMWLMVSSISIISWSIFNICCMSRFNDHNESYSKGRSNKKVLKVL